MDNNSQILKAAFLLGTLKRSDEFSHTEVLSQLVMEEFKKHHVESELVWLSEHRIPPGTRSDMGTDDDWPKILEKVFASDIIIFATPIWWGIESSLIRRCIERMDELNDKLLESGESELGNKVGGLVITGAEDGPEHIIGNISEFMVWNGLTMPPACSVSHLGGYPDSKEELAERFRQHKGVMSQARVMTANLSHLARVLKVNPYPQNPGPLSQSFV